MHITDLFGNNISIYLEIIFNFQKTNRFFMYTHISGIIYFYKLISKIYLIDLPISAIADNLD